MEVLLNSFCGQQRPIKHPHTDLKSFQITTWIKTMIKDTKVLKLTFLAKNLKSSVFRILPDLQSTLKKGFRQFTTTLESCGRQMERKNTAQN